MKHKKGRPVQLDVVILRHLSVVFVSLINYNINFCTKEFLKNQEDFTIWFYFDSYVFINTMPRKYITELADVHRGRGHKH